MRFPTAICELLATFVHGDDIHLLASLAMRLRGQILYFGKADRHMDRLAVVTKPTEEVICTGGPYANIERYSMWSIQGPGEGPTRDAALMARLARHVFFDPMERLLTLLMERDVICTTILARMLPLPRPIGALVCTFLAGDVGCQALALAEPSRAEYELVTQPGDYIRQDLDGSKLTIRSRLFPEDKFTTIYTELTLTTTSRDGSTECLRDRQLSAVATKKGDIRNSSILIVDGTELKFERQVMDALRKVLKDPEEVIIRTYGLPPDLQRAILTKVIDGVSFSI